MRKWMHEEQRDKTKMNLDFLTFYEQNVLDLIFVT